MQTLKCSFEKGDDCSWIKNDGLWKVWRGTTPNLNTGPASADQGV